MDIVDWLRSGIMVLWGDKPSRLHEAADEIERLREALKRIAEIGDHPTQLTIARSALQQKDTE